MYLDIMINLLIVATILIIILLAVVVQQRRALLMMEDRRAALDDELQRGAAEVLKAEDAVEQMSAELAEFKARYRSYFDLPLFGAAITSPDKGWVEVNAALCNMLGYSAEELAGRTWPELTYPDDLAADNVQFQRLLAGEIDSYALEKRFIRKDGTIVWTYMSVGCVRRADRSVDYIVALARDISESKEAEQALHRSEVQYRLLAENMVDVIWTMDPAGRFTYVSPSVEKLRGYTPQEVLAQSPGEALTSASLMTMQSALLTFMPKIERGAANFIEEPAVLNWSSRARMARLCGPKPWSECCSMKRECSADLWAPAEISASVSGQMKF
jgi:PAS domain S-box-containing protein